MSIVSIQITTDQLRQLDALCALRGESRSALALAALLSELAKGTEPAPSHEVVEGNGDELSLSGNELNLSATSESAAYKRGARAPKKEA